MSHLISFPVFFILSRKDLNSFHCLEREAYTLNSVIYHDSGLLDCIYTGYALVVARVLLFTHNISDISRRKEECIKHGKDEDLRQIKLRTNCRAHRHIP